MFKKHYERYDLDTVCSICGMDRDTLELVYKTYSESGAPGKSGTILYALGQTQHSYGGQNTRAMSILQLLLNNIGIPGGGVNALRGEPNVQGATDMAMMVDEQPGYLKWANTTDRRRSPFSSKVECFAGILLIGGGTEFALTFDERVAPNRWPSIACRYLLGTIDAYPIRRPSLTNCLFAGESLVGCRRNEVVA